MTGGAAHTLRAPARPAALAEALTGLLNGAVPLPEQLFELAADLVAEELPGGTDSTLACALAGHPGAPEHILELLAHNSEGSPVTAERLLANPSASARLRARVARQAVYPPLLRSLAAASTDPVVLDALAERACAQPRSSVRERWSYNHHAGTRTPAAACLWEDVLRTLLANPALPTQTGRELVRAAIAVHLSVDVERVARPGADTLDWEDAITAPAVLRWLRSDSQLASELARADDVHPWVLDAAAGAESSPLDVRVRAFWELLAPVLAFPGEVRKVPANVAVLTVHLAGRLPAEETALLVQWLNSGWDLTMSHSGLRAIACPPPPPTVAPPAQFYATGPLPQVLEHVQDKLAGAGRIAVADGEVLLARTDLPTEVALQVARACNQHSRTWLTVRSFDAAFTAAWAARSPGWWPQLLAEGQVDLVLAAICARAEQIDATGSAGLSDLAPSVIGPVAQEGTLALLGEHALRLPWPILARLTGRHPDIDAAVAAHLAAVAACPGGPALLALVAASHDGDVSSMRDALTGALT